MARRTAMGDGLPPAAGPYSHVAMSARTIYSSGQGGADATGRLDADIAVQCGQCFANVFAALAAGGASERDVVKMTVYLTAIEHFPAMNEAYAKAFTAPYPARTTVYVALPPGMLIEADAIAVTQEAQP